MLIISNHITIPDNEIEIQAIRAQGAGGQNVNKVSSAVHLRFNISTSSLPELYKVRLSRLKDKRITKEGVIVIKSQTLRTFEKNKAEALNRLLDLIRSVTRVQKKRKPTRPTEGSKRKRVDKKVKRGQTKTLRGKVKF